MKFTEIKTADEYMDLASKYSWLADTELAKIEVILSENQEKNAGDVITSIPKLISMVNVVGYLRGQNGAFLGTRPQSVVEHQSELQNNEDSFEARLAEIIRIACKDPGNRNVCEFCLTQYYLNARLPKKDA